MLNGPAFAGTEAGAAGAKTPADVFVVEDAASHKHILRIEERSDVDGLDLVQQRQFKDLNDVVAGAESVRFGRENVQLRTYRFEDLGTGEQSDLEISGGKAVARYRANKTAPTQSGELAWGPRTVTGNLFPALILKHWEALDGNGTFVCELYVPFRLETIPFRLTRQVHEDKTVTVVAEARNWLIRQFAPAISFQFSGETPPRLIKYHGPAPLQIGNEKIKAVEIKFNASPLAANTSAAL